MIRKSLSGPSSSMRTAAVIQFISKYANVAIQLVLSMILARLISPEEYGVVSIVSVVTAFFTTFSDAGIGVAVVQFRELEERDFGALFFFSLLLGLALSSLLCAVSTPVSTFYGDDSLAPLCCTASVSLLLSTLNMVPNGLMLRERRFAAIGIRLVLSTAVGGAIGVVMALLGFGAYALMGQSIATAALVLALNLLARPLRELNVHFMNPLRLVFSYSAFQLGANAVNYFNRNFDSLALGKVLGMGPLGYYNKAYNLTTYPVNALSSVIASVVQPFMAEHQSEKDLIFDCFMRIEKGLSLVAAPIAACFFCAPTEVINLVYGPQWANAVVPFQVLGLSVYFQMLGNPAGAFFQSLGRTDLMFRQGLVNTCLTVGGIIFGCVFGGLEAVSVCVSVAFCIQMVPIVYFLVIRGFGRSVAEFRVLLPEIAIAAIAACVCTAISSMLGLTGVLSLATKLLAISAIFAFGYRLTGQFAHLRMFFARS